MGDKKQRTEIPKETAADALFDSDRTCCICRERKKPIQIHHIDEDPNNNSPENLAVLCFDCHRETQIRGGFDRKLDAAQIHRYKLDWISRVAEGRAVITSRPRESPARKEYFLRYFQEREKSEEYLYDIEADYVLVGSPDDKADGETNMCIYAEVTKLLQRFRRHAIERKGEKQYMKAERFGIGWDSLAISHSVPLFAPNIISIELQLVSYYAGAAHPNHATKTLNFLLQPPAQLELDDVFKAGSDYLKMLSRACIDDLHKQKMDRWRDCPEMIEQLKQRQEEWILRGAGPERRNFQNVSFRKHGIVVHFDEYQVGSYAEGEYSVFIPAHEFRGVLENDVAAALKWR